MTKIFIRSFDDYFPMDIRDSDSIDEETIASLAVNFLEELGKDYDLRGKRSYNPKVGNSSWFTETFFEWAENNRIPCKIIDFVSKKNPDDHHMAILFDDLVLDFAHKRFSKDKNENFSILNKKKYRKYSENFQVFEEFPVWIKDLYPLRKK